MSNHYSSIVFITLSLQTILLVTNADEDSGNFGSELVDIMNQNRTTSKLPKLYDNPGLGCMALQYISRCKYNCTSKNTAFCHPPDDDITEVFAPNCGVELPTLDTVSDHIVGCRWKHVKPEEAFSDVLFQSKKSLSALHNKNHTEVGVGLVRARRGPLFWCVLFSNGLSNSSFVLRGGGKGIEQKTGCYSGTEVSCNAAARVIVPEGPFVPTILSTMLCLFMVL